MLRRRPRGHMWFRCRIQFRVRPSLRNLDWAARGGCVGIPEQRALISFFEILSERGRNLVTQSNPILNVRGIHDDTITWGDWKGIYSQTFWLWLL